MGTTTERRNESSPKDSPQRTAQATAAKRLAADDSRLERDGLITLELASADQLLTEPTVEPLGRPGPYQSGVAYASSMLAAAPRLPEAVTVRVILDDDLDDGVQARAQRAFRDYCRFRAEDAWRQAMTVRRTGRRQMPRALLVAAVAAALAAAFGSLAQNVHGDVLKAVLLVISGVGVIAAWVVSWMPIEQVFFDWRPQAHFAAVFDLLQQARIEFVHPSAVNRLGTPQTGRDDPARGA